MGVGGEIKEIHDLGDESFLLLRRDSSQTGIVSKMIFD